MLYMSLRILSINNFTSMGWKICIKIRSKNMPNINSDEECYKVSCRFLTSEISYKEFVNLYFSNQYLRNYYDRLSKELNRINPNESVYRYYRDFEEFVTIFYKNGRGNFSTITQLYEDIYKMECVFHQDVPFTSRYPEWSLLSIEAIPDYAEGDEATEFIEKEIFEKIPEDLSEAKKVKWCKEQVKHLFHIEGNKYPHWVQSGEWPMINNKPGMYVGRKRDHDKVDFIFEDPETKEQRIVTQYY